MHREGGSIETEPTTLTSSGSMPSGGVPPPFPTDMDVDAEEAIALEKTDVDFFNGNNPVPQLKSGLPDLLLHLTAQILRMTLMMTIFEVFSFKRNSVELQRAVRCTMMI